MSLLLSIQTSTHSQDLEHAPRCGGACQCTKLTIWCDQTARERERERERSRERAREREREVKREVKRERERGGRESNVYTYTGTHTYIDSHRQTHLRLQGKTPLHVAAEAGNLAGVKHLLNHGASLTLTDCNGRTPAMIARPQTSIHQRLRFQKSTKQFLEDFGMPQREVERSRGREVERSRNHTQAPTSTHTQTPINTHEHPHGYRHTKPTLSPLGSNNQLYNHAIQQYRAALAAE